MDTSAHVVLIAEDGTVLSETEVPLASFNYCGRDVAYVEYLPTHRTWSDVQYLNPCRQ